LSSQIKNKIYIVFRSEAIMGKLRPSLKRKRREKTKGALKGDLRKEQTPLKTFQGEGW